MDIKTDNGPGGLVRTDYPSNAHTKTRYDGPKEEPKTRKVERVTTSKVVVRKKSFGKKFIETFIGDNISNVGSYILYDILIPAAKSTIYDMVKGSFEMALFPDKQGSRTSRDRGQSRVNYVGFSSDLSRSSIRDNDRNRREPMNRARHNFDDLLLTTRGEAEDVLSHLVDLVIDYGQASVADLYDLVGITGTSVDNNYGWTDLRSASVSRARDGYLLNLPRTNPLN